jgi:hypothetical protein
MSSNTFQFFYFTAAFIETKNKFLKVSLSPFLKYITAFNINFSYLKL